LLTFDMAGVSFRYKEYRSDGAAQPRLMTLAANGFIRRVLPDLLPPPFHRIRDYGLLYASAHTVNLGRGRERVAARCRAMTTYRNSRSTSVSRAHAATRT